MTDDLVSFVLAGLALAGSPGPNTLSIAAVSAAFGWSRAAFYMLGLVLGMVGVMVIVGTGVSGLLLALPGARPVVTLLAVAYFAFLAYRIATAPPLRRGDDAGRVPRWYEGTALSLINPKAYAAMAALFSGFVLVPGDPIPDAVLKTVVALAILLSVNVVWLAIGSGLTRVMGDARRSRAINIGFAIALLVSVGATLLL